MIEPEHVGNKAASSVAKGIAMESNLRTIEILFGLLGRCEGRETRRNTHQSASTFRGWCWVLFHSSGYPNLSMKLSNLSTGISFLDFHGVCGRMRHHFNRLIVSSLIAWHAGYCWVHLGSQAVLHPQQSHPLPQLSSAGRNMEKHGNH